ncbi:hypothetical protein NT6N_06660 [Oceaniferula spumae]|uniref:Endonuclease/exonuclease/phosphatase domain-containing protein n=1 Tax=Oceaniferula spumae TaxID=2979115 RepID=A0AAT9FI34_9BACT
MSRHPISIKSASILLGAFFCLFVSACDEKKSVTTTTEWENESRTAVTEQSVAASTAKADTKTATKANAPDTDISGESVRFLSYNLRNYLTMRRYIDGKSSEEGKPEEEIAALLKVIVEGQPDVLGVCEIGSKEDLAGFQKRLAAEGIDLPNLHHVQGADTVRSLAILSKYPLVSTATPKEDSYQLSGKPFRISRGILDATVKLPSRSVRFLGVHLKSKRPVKDADEEMIRRNEAYLLRKHIDEILTADPKANLMVYGDFNDTKRTKTVYAVKGRSNSSKRLEMLEVPDSRGELWTHHWTREDIYSRIDFCMVSLALSPHIEREECKLLDPSYWDVGSDHRALLVLIK